MSMKRENNNWAHLAGYDWSKDDETDDIEEILRDSS